MVHSFKGVDMSQGGQGMFATEPAVTVIGSDGKMYNNPSAARAAGVYPEPVQLGGPAESYGQPTIGVPTLRSGMPGVDSSMFSTGMPTIGVPTLRSGNPGVDSSMFSNGVTYPNQPPSNGMTQYGPGGIGYPMGYDQPVPMPGISAGGKGGGMLEPAVTVTGSDGKMYGSPSAARAAGAYPESRSYDQPVPMPGISAGAKGGAKGGANPYSQIMGQNRGGDPYSQIMGQMPTLQNPYATSTNEPFGGYDPRIYNNAFVGSNSRLNLSGLIGGGGGGDATTNPFSDLTQAERAAYYSQNPNMGTITQLGQKALGFTSLGALSKAMNPGLWSEEGLVAMGINPAAYQAAKEGFRAKEIADMNAGYLGYAPSYETGVGIPGESYTGGFTSYESGVGNPGESYGGYTSSDTGVGNPGESYGGNTSSDTGTGNPGESGGGGNTSSDTGTGNPGESYYMGGLVDKVGGRNPAGPDDGTGMLDLGEYVIKKSAVKKYGQGLLDMINNGKIPAKKIKSLLG